MKMTMSSSTHTMTSLCTVFAGVVCRRQQRVERDPEAAAITAINGFAAQATHPDNTFRDVRCVSLER